MRSLAPFLVLLAACSYITEPYANPADPVTVDLVNRSAAVVYLPLTDARTPLDAALTFAAKGSDPFKAALSCADVSCSAGCDVQTCARVSAVRELSPGEALLVDWDNFRYDEGELACTVSGESRACVSGSRVPKGRYLARVCFGRGIKAAAAQMQRSAADPQIIVGAALDVEECLTPLELGVPGYNVRYEIEIR